MDDAYERSARATTATFTRSRFWAFKLNPSRPIWRSSGPTGGKRPSISIAFPSSATGSNGVLSK